MNRNSQLKKLLFEADKAELSGDLSTSAKLLKQALAIEYTESLLLQLGNLERKRKRFREAIKRFDEAIMMNPVRVVTYLVKAQCLISLRDFKEAKNTLDRTLKFEKRPDAFVQLGSVCETLRKKNSARKSYQAALSIAPRYEEAHYNLGRLLRRSNPKKSLFHLKYAVKIDPNYAAAHAELGALLLQLKRYVEAESTIRKAILLDRESFWNHLYLANLLWQRGRLAEAEEEYRAACQLDRSSFSARCLAKFLKSK